MKRFLFGASLFASVIGILIASSAAQDKKSAPPKRTLAKSATTTKWQPVAGWHGKTGQPLDLYEETSEYATISGTTLTQHWRTYDETTDVSTPRTTVYEFGPSTTCTIVEDPNGGLPNEIPVDWTITSTFGTSRGKQGSTFAGKLKAPGLTNSAPDQLWTLGFLPGKTVDCFANFTNNTDYNYYLYKPQLTPADVRDNQEHNVSFQMETRVDAMGNVTRIFAAAPNSLKFTSPTATEPGKLIIVEAGVTIEYEATFPQFEGTMPLLENNAGWIVVNLKRPDPEALRGTKAAAVDPLLSVGLLKLADAVGGWLFKQGPEFKLKPPTPQVFSPFTNKPNKFYSVDPWFPPFAPRRIPPVAVSAPVIPMPGK